MSAAASAPAVENVAVRVPVEPAATPSWSATAPAIVAPPAWLTRAVISGGVVHVPAAEDSAPAASTSSSAGFVVVSDGATTVVPLGVVALELTSIGFTGSTPR